MRPRLRREGKGSRKHEGWVLGTRKEGGGENLETGNGNESDDDGDEMEGKEKETDKEK